MIDDVATGAIPLMFAFAFGMMFTGCVLDSGDMVVVGFALVCVLTLILMGLSER